jgi:hypothetical protein
LLNECQSIYLIFFSARICDLDLCWVKIILAPLVLCNHLVASPLKLALLWHQNHFVIWHYILVKTEMQHVMKCLPFCCAYVAFSLFFSKTAYNALHGNDFPVLSFVWWILSCAAIVSLNAVDTYFSSNFFFFFFFFFWIGTFNST